MCVNKTIYTDALTTAYRHFNATLFDGELPEAVLTLHHQKNSAGHFANDRWKLGSETIHEINLNPTVIKEHGEQYVLSTLVHEMAHQWQEVFGKPSRGGYHNRQWVKKMLEIGLKPKSLDSENGTGQRVTHTIIEEGAFARAYNKLAARKGWSGIDWHRVDDSNLSASGKRKGDPDGEGQGGKTKPKRKTKVKYSCGSCGNNAWGKSGMMIACLCTPDLAVIMIESQLS